MPTLRAPSPAAILLGLALAAAGSSAARAEPPIRSVEDAACRLEARARVFTAPNPRGLELETIGRAIYAECMRRSQLRAAPRKRHRTHRRHRD